MNPLWYRLEPSSRRLLAVAGLAGLTLAIGLGSAGRLTYHEAIAAQAAREMIVSGDPIIPTLGGRPWLEKPPLTIWLIAFGGMLFGEVSEFVARLPSALAALCLAVSVAWYASKRFGPGIGLLAGLIQATTVWNVNRGRLAEPDILLAAIVSGTLIAFDALRTEANSASPTPDETRLRRSRWGFFLGLGLTSLAKGIGFGAVMVLGVVALATLLDRDRKTLQALKFWQGWLLSASIGLVWPLLVLRVHPSAFSLWFLHVSDRMAETPKLFDGQTWPQYLVALLGYLLPWVPLSFVGGLRSVPKIVNRFSSERYLIAWFAAPFALLSLATIKHAHYVIYALPPCSIWGALGLVRLGGRLQERGFSVVRVRRLAWGAFLGLGLAFGIGFAVLGPWLDRRGKEWAFYETLAPKLRPSEPLVLLYRVPEWDREPYSTPFGPVPHDLAVRLYYLKRPATYEFGLDDLRNEARRAGQESFAVIGRESDRPELETLGKVDTLAEGPPLRFDRTYRLFRVRPGSEATPIALKPGEASGLNR